VPDREGWETNVAIAERYAGTGGDAFLSDDAEVRP
jgi:hypothetical protein